MSIALIPVLCLAYIVLMFGAARLGERWARDGAPFSGLDAAVYTLSLAIFTTAWSYYGHIHKARETGIDFLPLYVAPGLVLIVLGSVIIKMIETSRSQEITSIADFISFRYGKSRAVEGLVTLVAFFGVLLYITVQLKALGESISITMGLLAGPDGSATAHKGVDNFTSWCAAGVLAAIMAWFTIRFGVRDIKPGVRNPGLMLAVAFESFVKLVFFVLMAILILFVNRSHFEPHILGQSDVEPIRGGMWVATIAIASCGFLCMPQMFHVTVLENKDKSHVHIAAKWYILYLAAVSVVIITIASINIDVGAYIKYSMLKLACDLGGSAHTCEFRGEVSVLLTFIGGFSAATGMMMVAAVSLSTMLSNLFKRSRRFRPVCDVNEAKTLGGSARPATNRAAAIMRRIGLSLFPPPPGGGHKPLLKLRQGFVYVVFALAFLLMKLFELEDFQLADVGMVAFTIVAQLGPALLIGMYWPTANRWGVIVGVSVGMAAVVVKLYPPLHDIIAGPASPAPLIELVKNYHYAQVDAAFWSLMLNAFSIAVVSIYFPVGMGDRKQALIFTDANARVRHVNTKIYIIHGREHKIRDELVEYLRALDLTPILMDEMETDGLADSFTTFLQSAAPAGYAIVILTPDDVGGLKGDVFKEGVASGQINSKALNERARQNVIFELGYFVGRVGDSRVTLLQTGYALEYPSDIKGRWFIDYSRSNWKSLLRRRLERAGMLAKSKEA